MRKNKVQKKGFLNGSISHQLLLLFFPLFSGYLLQQLYGFVDSMILGSLISKEALAAVGGSANSLINIVLNFIGGIASAITVRVAQSCGEGNPEKVNRVIKTAMSLSVFLGTTLGVFLFLLSPFWLNIMNEPLQTRTLTSIYLGYYFGSLLFYFIYQIGICIWRAMGDSRRPLLMIGITAFSKIALDLLFAGCFQLGIRGTSLATFLSHFICAGLILFVFYKSDDNYSFSLKDFGFDKKETKEILRIGLPFSIQSMMFVIPNAIIQYKINSFGTDAIAAYSAYSNVDALFWCFSSAISTATITMASQNFGRNNFKRIRKVTLSACLIEEVGVLIYGLMFYFGGRDLLSLFLKEETALFLSIRMLRINAFTYSFTVIVDVFSSVFKSCGLIKMPLFIAIFTICVSRILYIFFYPIDDPLKTICVFPLSWALTSIAYIIYYFYRKDIFLREN